MSSISGPMGPPPGGGNAGQIGMQRERMNLDSQRMRIPIEHGANALSDPITPGNRLPVVDKSKVDPQILKVAQGFESMFMDLMLKEMRKTVPKNEFDLEGPATEIYRSMMDEESVQKAVKSGGVGLADQIVAYLQTEGYTNRQAHSPNDSEKGRSKPAALPTTADNRSKQGGLP